MAVRLVLLFLFSYCALYSVNYVLTGLIQPGGYYNYWFANNLDYISTLRFFLLNSTSFILHLFGFETSLDGNILWVNGGRNIRMVYSCIGINMLCIWWAFVIVAPMRAKSRVVYFILGTMCLIVLNIFRLIMLTTSTGDYSFGEFALEHHTIYNCVVYGIILIAIKRVIDKKILN